MTLPKGKRIGGLLHALGLEKRFKIVSWKTVHSQPMSQVVYSGMANGMIFKATHKNVPSRKISFKQPIRPENSDVRPRYFLPVPSLRSPSQNWRKHGQPNGVGKEKKIKYKDIELFFIPACCHSLQVRTGLS